MVKQSELYRRFIREVINKLPPYIAQYKSPDDQKMLMNFLTLLKSCDTNTDFKRSTLLNEIYTFYREQRSKKAYIVLPFLWFVVSYFDNAHLLLEVADYHAKDFFEYLMRSLRGSSDVKGVFKLIQKATPLMSRELVSA